MSSSISVVFMYCQSDSQVWTEVSDGLWCQMRLTSQASLTRCSRCYLRLVESYTGLIMVKIY